MSLVNVAYAPRLTWANPTLDSLEEQALIPMLGEDPIELGLKGHEQEFLDTVRRDPVYQRLFPQAFPDAGDAYHALECHQGDRGVRANHRLDALALRPLPLGRRRLGDLGCGEARRTPVLFQRTSRMLSVPRRLELQRGSVRRQPDRNNIAAAMFFNTGVSRVPAAESRTL